MPLLPPEPFVYPETLLSDDPPRDEDSSFRWWVLHTRPRAEKSLARQLLHDRTSFFLPVSHQRWRNKGRLLRSYPPLFPGYVFLRGADDARLSALKTNLVANILPVADQDQLQADLVRVRSLMESGAPLSPEEHPEPGTPVEITAGPLAGLEGKVLRRGRQFHFVIEVRLLQQGVSVEIESWMFRPVKPSPAVEPARLRA
jgi:transcription antitermination factor NusG